MKKGKVTKITPSFGSDGGAGRFLLASKKMTPKVVGSENTSKPVKIASQVGWVPKG